MRIQINNFGPIQKMDLDLNNQLTIIYGKNSIGKSYSMTLAYLIIKNLMKFRYNYQSFYNPLYNFFESYQIKDNELQNLKELHKNKNVTDELKSIVLEFLNNTLALELTKSLKNSFGDLSDFNNAKINMILDLKESPVKARAVSEQCEKIELEFTISESKIRFNNLNLDAEIIYTFNSSNKMNGSFRWFEKTITFEKTDFNGNIYQDLEGIVYFLLNSLINSLTDKFNDQYFFIPASRSGLYFGLKNFNSIFLKISQNKDQFPEGVPLQDITEPASDFYLNLTKINKISKNKEFLKISSLFEERILNGNLSYNVQDNNILYKDNDSNKLIDLENSSSMIAEISLLTVFFKYIINKGDVKYKGTSPIIFIEEPEAHLHPEKQIEIAEILAEIIKISNIKIVISSHSNYIFNKLNNLILNKKIDFKDYNAYIMKKEQKGSVTSLLEIDEMGVDDENFSDVSEYLYNERLEIIEEINNHNESEND